MALLALLFGSAIMVTAQTVSVDEQEQPLTLEALVVQGYANGYSEVTTDSATRIEASLTEIPLSIQVLPSQLLEDQGIVDADDALKNVSGASAIAGFDTRPHLYSIRGFYNFNYRDGFRMPLDAYVGVNPFGLEKIEVLKGPATIIYGKGDPGGIVNFTSARPLSKFQGVAQATFGSDSYYRGDFDVTGPAGEGFAYRLVTSHEDAGSYRDQVESTTTYINPSVTAYISETSKIWVAYENSRLKTVPDSGVLILPDGSLTPLSRRSDYYGSAEDTYKVTQYRFIAELETQVNDSWNSRLSYVYDQGDARDSSRLFNLVDAGPTGYLGLLPSDNVLRIQFNESPERKSNSVRWENHFDFNVGTTEHQLLVAIDYRDESSKDTMNGVDHSLLNYKTGVVSNILDLGALQLPFKQGHIYDDKSVTDGTVNDLGIAVQDLIRVNDRLNILVGLRWEKSETESSQTGSQTITGAFGGQPVSLDTGILSSEADQYSPRLGVLFKASEEVSLYASYLTSFISPIPGRVTAAGNTLKPERARQFEVGAKFELKEGKIFINTAAFLIQKEDAFVHFATVSENIGEEEASGFEIDIAGALTYELQVIASFGYVDMEFVKADALLQGHTRAGVPDITASVWGVYSPTRVKGLTLGAGLFLTGETWANFNNTVAFDSITTVDAMIAYDFDKWRFQANLYNLTDKLGHAASGGYAAGLAPNVNPLYGFPTNGFNFRLSAQLKF